MKSGKLVEVSSLALFVTVLGCAAARLSNALWPLQSRTPPAAGVDAGSSPNSELRGPRSGELLLLRDFADDRVEDAESRPLLKRLFPHWKPPTKWNKYSRRNQVDCRAAKGLIDACTHTHEETLRGFLVEWRKTDDSGLLARLREQNLFEPRVLSKVRGVFRAMAPVETAYLVAGGECDHQGSGVSANVDSESRWLVLMGDKKVVRKVELHEAWSAFNNALDVNGDGVQELVLRLDTDHRSNDSSSANVRMLVPRWLPTPAARGEWRTRVPRGDG